MSSNHHADDNQGDEPDTRTIARQAVEKEFRKNKKRGYDSSDDEAGGGKKHKMKSKQQQQQQQQQNKSTRKKTTTRPVAVWEVKYRDRAKERREGKKPVDEQQQESQHVAAATSGATAAQSLLFDVLEDDNDDDENSHDKPMVLGLDRTMIEKDHETQQEQSEDTSRFVANRSEAIEWLSSSSTSDNNDDKVHSALGRALLPVLQQTYLPATTPNTTTGPTRAGLALQRSTWILDTRPHLSQAWRVPRQEQAAATTTTSTMSKISPIHNVAILQRMQRVLDRQRQLETHVVPAKNTAPTAAKAPMDGDEDIFAIDDDDDNKDANEGNKQPKEEKEKSSQSTSTKKRKTFFFHTPLEDKDKPEEDGTTVAATTAPVVTRLERLSSQVDQQDDYQPDVDFDGRIEEEAEGKKKKKRRRKKKDGDDSD